MTDPMQKELTEAAAAALHNQQQADSSDAAQALIKRELSRMTAAGKVFSVTEEERAVLQSFRLWKHKQRKPGATFRYQIGDPFEDLPWSDKITSLRRAAQAIFESGEDRERIRRVLQDHRDDVDVKLLCLWDETPVETILAAEGESDG